MKIQFHHDGLVETSISLEELIDEIFDRPYHMAQPLAISLLSGAVEAVREMQDEEIEKLPERVRKNIAKILIEQAGRYDPESKSTVRPEPVEGQPHQLEQP